MEEWRGADRDPDRDPGLAADRTTLAWRRSGISVVAVGLAVAKGIPTVGDVPGRPLVGLAIVGLGAVAFVVSSVQAGRRARHAGTDRPAGGAGRSLAGVGGHAVRCARCGRRRAAEMTRARILTPA